MNLIQPINIWDNKIPIVTIDELKKKTLLDKTFLTDTQPGYNYYVTNYSIILTRVLLI